MAAQSLFRNASQRDAYICGRCAIRNSKRPRDTGRRMIGTKWLAKKAAAEEDWKVRAKEIKEGKRKSMLSILEERGLVHQIAG